MQDALPVTGTLAVLLNAKERGIIPKVRDTLDVLFPPTSGSLTRWYKKPCDELGNREWGDPRDIPGSVGSLARSTTLSFDKDKKMGVVLENDCHPPIYPDSQENDSRPLMYPTYPAMTSCIRPSRSLLNAP